MSDSSTDDIRKQQYELTGNPLWIWKAIEEWASSANDSFPEWCRLYLFEASKGIISAGEAGRAIDVKIKQALQLTGHHYHALSIPWRNAQIWWEVAWRIQQGIAVQDACEQASAEAEIANMLSPDSIHDIYLKYDKIISSISSSRQ